MILDDWSREYILALAFPGTHNPLVVGSNPTGPEPFLYQDQATLSAALTEKVIGPAEAKVRKQRKAET